MAQEHAEFILELKQNTENKTHKDFPVQKVPKNYQQEGHLAFQNEENKISQGGATQQDTTKEMEGKLQHQTSIILFESTLS